MITNDAIFVLLLAAAVRLACQNVWFYLNSASSILIHSGQHHHEVYCAVRFLVNGAFLKARGLVWTLTRLTF